MGELLVIASTRATGMWVLRPRCQADYTTDRGPPMPTWYRTPVRSLLLVTALLSLHTRSVRGQSSADSAGIRGAAFDYIEGWYAGDGDRMARALHSELVKRIVITDSTGHSRIQNQSAMTLIEGTRAGGGRRTPIERQRKDFAILDIYHGAAVARIVASDWVDYLELAKWNGQWKIVNVLWERTPQGETP